MSITPAQLDIIANLEVDPEGWVKFSEVAQNVLYRQAQYVSRYVGGLLDYPDLGEGLRFLGDANFYHSLRIQADDVSKFVNRVMEYGEDPTTW